MASDNKRSRFEERIKERQNQVSQNSNGEGVETSSSNTQTSSNAQSRFEERIKERQSGVTNNTTINSDFISTFLLDAEDYISNSKSRYSKLGFSNASDAWNKNRKEANNLLAKGYSIRDYLSKNRSSMDEKSYESLAKQLDSINEAVRSYTGAFRDARKFYSQWETEDAYNKWKKDTEEYEAMMAYDTKKGAKEIEDLMKQAEADEKEYWNLYDLRTQYSYGATLGQPDDISMGIDARMKEILDKYGAKNIKDIQNNITQKKAYQTQAERLQEGVRLGAVGDKDSEYYDPEYAYWANTRGQLPTRDDLVAYDSKMDQSKWYTDANGKLYDAYGTEIDPYNTDGKGKILHPSQGSVDSSDKLGIFLSASEEDVDEASGTYLSTGGTWETIVAEGSQRHWDRMEESEINTYYYYLNKEGSEAAEKYLDSIQETLNRREGAEMFTAMKDKTALELLFKVAVGLDQWGSSMQGMRNAITGNDEYTPVSATQYAGSLVQEDLGDVGPKLPEWMSATTDEYGNPVRTSIAQAAGDFITTGANMLPSILTSVAVNAIAPGAGIAIGGKTIAASTIASNAVLGASAYGGAYNEMINFGYDKNQSRTYASLVGASEIALQGLLGGVSQLGGGVISNGVTKALGKADNVLAKLAIQFGNSNLGKVIVNAFEEGSEEYFQAILEPWFKNIVFGEENEIDLLSEEALYSALLGALTGGVFEGSGLAVESVNSNAMLRDTGKAITAADGGVDALKALAMDVSSANPKLTAQANKVSSEPATGEGLVGKAVAAVKNSSNQKKVGKLYQAVEAEVTKQNQADIAKSLERKGFSAKSAKNIAEAMMADMNGEQLNSYQKAVLESVGGNELVQKTVNDVLNNASSTTSQRSSDLATFAVGIGAGVGIAPNASRTSSAKQIGTKGVTEGDVTGNAESLSQGSYEVSAEGKSIRKSDGETIDIQGIAAFENGRMVLDTDAGTVDASDVAYASKNDALVYEAVAELSNIIDPDTANKLVKKFNPADGVSAQSYARGIVQAYTYGYYGYSRTETMGSNTMSATLTDAQRNTAYGLGQQYRNKATAAKQDAVSKKVPSNKKGQVFFRKDNMAVSNFRDYMKEDGRVLTDVQAVAVQTMEKLSVALGVNFYVYESYVKDGKRYYIDENGVEQEGAPNGWYDPTTGNIYIDLHAGNTGKGTMIFTVAHELTHFIYQWSPAKFKKLADFVFKHGGFKDRGAKLVQAKMDAAERRGKPISYETAYEEVVADGMESILKSGNVVQMMAEIKQKDHTLWQKICDWFKDLVKDLRALVDAYKGYSPETTEGQMVADMKAAIRQIEAIYTEALVDASENFQSAMETVVEADAKTVAEEEIITDGAVVTDGEGKKYSIRSMKQDVAEGQMFEDLKTYCNWTQKQVNELRNNLADLVEYMTPYRNILDMNETYGREGRRFSPYKPNSDPLYKISMDFSTLCSKRLLTQYVIENLQLRENRPMSAEEQMAIRDMLNEYRKVEKGLQVACAMCYVEAARLKSPKQITKWMEDPGTQMKNYFADKNPEFANFIKEKQADFKESRGYDRNATKKDMSPKDVRELNKIRPRVRSQYQLSAEEAEIVERAKSLPGSTYLTAGNLASLSETDPTIYAAYTAFVRTATRSKSLETDEPYYYGDSRRDNGNGIIVSDSFIESVNRENGMRFSSWSDWRIQHLLDYITAVIDNSVRGAAMHGYTKFGEEVRVLGKTGMMFNMSGVAGTQTGLNEDGSLSFSPTESIDVNEAIQLREEFPDTAGLQCIGVGDDHIIALLRSDIIDYVIPYHVSGLNAGLRAMANIHGWKDYTSTQHAAIDKSIKFENAVDQEHWHEEPVYSEFFVGYDTGMTGIEAMRASADRYVQMCKDRGLKPKFEQFVNEDNYWKLLIDRKMVNQKTGKLIQQKAVTPTFDFDTVKSVVDQFVENYDSGLEARALNHIVENWDSIPKRIRDLKKQGSSKAKKASKAVDTMANQTLAAQPAEIKRSDRDSEGNSLTNEQSAFFAHSKVRDADGNLMVMYHGTDSANFTVFDPRQSDDYISLFFTSDPDVANTYTQLQDKGRDVDPYNLITKDSTAEQFNAAQERVGGGLRVVKITSEWIEEMKVKADKSATRLFGVANKYADLLAYNNSTGIFNYDIERIRDITGNGIEKLKADDINKLRKAMGDAQQHSFFAKDHKGAEKEIRRTYSDNFKLFDEVWNYKTAASTPDSAIGQYTYTETNSSVPFMVDRNLDFLGHIIPGTEQEMVAKALDRMKWVEEHHLGNRYKVYLNIKNPYVIDAGVTYSGKMKAVSLERSTANEKWKVTFENDEYDVERYMSTSSFMKFIETAFDAKTTEKIKAQIEADNEAYRKEWGDDFYEDMDVDHDIQLKNVNLNYTEAGNWNSLNFNGKENAKTREVAAWAKENGYDGVIFKNMKDAGGYAFMKGRGCSTVVTAFSSEQVKSVDNKNPTSDPDIRYSVREDIVDVNGVEYDRVVELDYRVFNKVKRSGKAYIDFIRNNLIKQKITVFDDNGDPEVIEFAGAKERVLKDGAKNKHPVIGELTQAKNETKKLVIVNAVETAEISRFAGENNEHKHQWLDENGWEERTSHVMTKDGTIYPVTLHIARARDGRNILYDVNVKINEGIAADKIATSLRAKKQAKQAVRTTKPSGNTVSQQKPEVKKFSDRDSESVSNRSLLANAFEGVAQNDIEKQRLQEYKGKISLIESEERKLSELNEQIKELSFAKGPKDTKAIRDLQFEAKQAANRISTYDKQLLRLEASKPLQDLLTREKNMAYKRAEKKGKEALEAYREKTMKTQRELIDKWQESRKKGIDSRQRTAMRHKIKDVVNELNQYLLHGTKDRHVPIELQKAVAEALDAVNMDTVGAEERIAKLEAELMKAKTPEQIQEISRKIDHIREMGDKMSSRLKKLKVAYDEIINSDDPLIANSHDDGISAHMMKIIVRVGDTPLREMTVEQLEDVYDVYRMVLTTIRNANKAFKAKKSESISVIANKVMMEVEKAGGKKKLSRKGTEGIKSFVWNNLKPVYAFEHIGSESFTEVFNAVRSGEDVWAKNVTEAREFYLDKSKKHSYDSWDFKKRFTFTSTSGMEFSLDLEQIMSLYAYSKRDQAADHLKKGGIVIDETTEITVKNKLGIPVKFNPTEATAYNLSDATLAEIISKLTAEQKSFVDEMQDYLSTVMGNKGNEVSLEMYGVKLFKEKFYFPLKSAQQFMAKAKEQQKGEIKIKNSGFSKETVQKASNPIVLTPFMNVWADHVNEMSMYHAFVLPMEDFYRVYNYKTPTSETMATESVEMFIQNAYGKGATQYIDQLLKDLNGGARTDHTTGIINKMMGLFKKGAVFASMSVVVQQPSAIARAAALVDTKYFIGPKVDHKKHAVLWDEVKQYAPVAVIKEMGYFDTNMGKSTQDFILAKEYSGFKDKMKALFTDSGFRDEALSKAPALADEIAWCGIWEAVKRETKAKYPGLDVKGEPFLKLAGSRFTEVIVKTQVYDSVLSRSGLMRSKDTGMKMATAFMAEPTTSINMIADALLQGKRGNRKYARAAIGAVIASQILNSILVSFVYAGRDDDEDETYWEKYIGTLSGEILDSLNPAGYIPFIKDIMSIVQGYDVERSDMAIISDLWKAYENLSKDYISPYRKVEGFVGSIAQIFGLPVKNIMRDARGIYQTINSFVNGQQTTKAGIEYAVKGAITGRTVSNDQQLYEAILSGDQAQIARVKGRFDDQSAVNSAIRKALRANDSRIHEAAIAWNANDLDEYMRIAKQIIAEKHFSQDDVVMAIRAEANKLAPSDGTSGASKAKGLFTAEKFAEAIAQGDQATANAIKLDIIQTAQKNGKTEDEAEKSFASSAKGDLKELYMAGTLSESNAIKALTTYCDETQEEAKQRVAEWKFEEKHGFKYDDKKEQFLAGKISASEMKNILMQVDGKTDEEANSSLVSYTRDAYEEGYFDRSAAASVMVTYGGLTEAEAESKLQYIDVKKQLPDTYVDDAWVAEYYKEVESSGISIEVFVDYRNQVKSITGEGKKERRMAVINSMPISNAQKDALYYAEGWAASRLYEAPWR